MSWWGSLEVKYFLSSLLSMVCPSWTTVLQNCALKIAGTYFYKEAALLLLRYHHELHNIHGYHTAGSWIQNRIRKVFRVRSGVKFHRWPPMTGYFCSRRGRGQQFFRTRSIQLAFPPPCLQTMHATWWSWVIPWIRSRFFQNELI